MKKKLLLSQLALQLLCLLIISSVFGQGESLRKTPSFINTQKKKKAPPILSTELKDRFGNTYTFDELLLSELSSTPTGGSSNANAIPIPPNYNTVTCNAGIFKLYFVDETNPAFGFGNFMYRNVICEVFTDLSRLLHNVSGSSTPFVKVLIASDSSIRLFHKGVALTAGTDIAGTSFYPSKRYQSHAWVDNVMYSTIKKGSSAYNLMNGSQQTNLSYSLAMHGLLVVNFTGKTWYTNFNDTASIPTNVEDLYTHTLHQAMHMLGIASLIDSAGNSSLGNKLYARWDNYLYKSTTSAKLLTYSTTTRKITASTLNFGCSSPNNTIFNGTSAGTLSIYNDNPWNKGINLSHFACSGSGLCNSTYAKPTNQMVMVPCLGSGTTYIKRHPSQAEVYALCDLGYKLRNVGGVYAYGNTPSNNASQGNVYQTYSSCTEPCIAIGGHDTILMDTIQQVCVRSFATSLLGNDVPSSSVISRLELLDTMKGTLTYTSTGFTFTPKPFLTYGDVSLVYYPQCSAGAELGSPTFITIKYPYPPLPPCQPNNQCNYVCNGTFEETDKPFQWSNFNIIDNQWYPNTPDLYRYDFGSTCVRNWIEDDWSGCDEPNGCSSFFNNTLNNQPHPAGGNQFIGIWATNFGYFEAFNLPLRKPLYHDTTKHYRMRLLAKTDAFADCNNPIFYVFADDTVPRMIPDGIRTYPKLNCNQFCDTIGLDTITSSTWTYYNFPIAQPAKGDSFTHIIISSQISISGGGETPPAEYYYAYFDNIEIYDSTAPKVIISSNPNDVMPCTDTGNTIQYTICLDNSVATNTDSIVVHIDLPYGFSVASGSDFNASGNYTIPAGAISGTVCDTLLLKYQMNFTQLGYNKGYDIKASYATNMFCTEQTSNVVKIYPQNNAVVITKTVSKANPNIGDTVIYNIEVCNQSNKKITDLQIVDTIPDGLIPDITTQFNVNGKVLTKTVTLDSANVSGWTCLSYFYSVVVTSSCRIQNTAYMQSPANPCFKGKSSVTLNSSSSASPVVATIRPQTVAWCGTNVPLSAIIQNPSGAYTYQWQRNGVNISGATSSNYTATMNGTYGVRIAQGGCSSTIPSVSFDTGFRVTTNFKRPNCTANNGFISILPQNGVPPYTYTWASSSSTAGTRINLGAGTYTVTVTDSIGCSRVITTTLNAIIDTLALVPILTHTQCNLPNGSIQLTASKGTPPYQFLWNDGSTLSNRTGLTAGTYSVILTDNFGCQLYDTFTLTNTSKKINFNDSIVRPLCISTTGTVKLKPSGGTAPYTYLWNDGNTSQLRTGLSPATYYVTVTDSMGCKGYDTIPLLGIVDTLKIKDSIVQPICSSLTGEIHLQPLISTDTFTYVWSNGATSAKILGLIAGIYRVTITSKFGCVRIDSFELNSNSNKIYNLDTIKQPSCTANSGSIITHPYGLGTSFSYLWSTGATTKNIANLYSGTYRLTVTDNFGCQDSFAYTLVAKQDTVKITKSVFNPICGNGLGSISITPIQGTAPFTYIWTDTYFNTNSRTNLPIKTYIVTIKDANGCQRKDTTILSSSTTVMKIDFSYTYNCTTNTANILSTVSGGTPTYTYLWNTGATTANISNVNVVTYPMLKLIVRDANGCKDSLSKSIGNWINIGTGTSYPTSSSLGKKFINNANLRLQGTFTVDSQLNLFRCQIVAQPSARILVQRMPWNGAGQSFSLGESRLYSCTDKLWRGIETTDRSILHITNCIIEDALYGVEIVDNVAKYITYNTFKNNFIGVLQRPIATGGQYLTANDFTRNFSYSHLSNNQFIGAGTGYIKTAQSGILINSYHSSQHPKLFTPNAQAWAGVEFNHSGSIAFFTNNQFSDMANGVIATDCRNVDLSGSIYQRIQPTNFPYPFSPIYQGICIQNYKLSTVAPSPYTKVNQSQLYYTGTGRTSSDKIVIDNGYWGIYTYKSSSIIGKARIKNLRSVIGSVIAEFIDYRELSLENCFEGIGVQHLTGYDLTISNNKMSIFGTYASSAGIDVNRSPGMSPLPPLASNIENDSIFMYNTTGYGIRLNNWDKQNTLNNTIAKNYINILNPSNTIAGIQYNKSVINELKNEVYANSRTAFNNNQSPKLTYPVGIHYNNTNGLFSCNKTYSIRTGMLFSLNCKNAKMSKNKFFNNSTGLKLDNTSTLQNDSSNGNTWLGAWTGAGILAAENLQSPMLTKFYVRLSAPIIFLPTPFFPSKFFNFYSKSGSENDQCRRKSPYFDNFLGIKPAYTSPIDFDFLRYQADQSQEDLWTASLGHSPLPKKRYQNPIRGFKTLKPALIPVPDDSTESNWYDYATPVSFLDETINQQIIDGLLSYDVYDPELVYQNEQMLLEQLNQVIDQIPDTSDAYEFFLAHDTSSMGKFYRIKRDERNAFELTEVQEKQVLEWKEAQRVHRETLKRIDSMHIAQNDSQHPQMDSAQWVAYIDALNSDSLGIHTYQVPIVHQYFNAIQQIDSLDYLIYKMDSAKRVVAHPIMDSLRARNAQISPQNRTEVLQKTYNEVHYATIAKRQFDLSEAQKETYRYLAKQCPVINPDVVYKSRAVIVEFGDTLDYQDYDTCFQAGIEYKSTKPSPIIKKKTSLQCDVYPNPARDIVYIRFSEIPKNRVSIVLRDLQGKEVYRYERDLSTNLIDIDTKNWSSGVYLVHILDGKTEVIHTKLTIAK